MLIIRTEEVLEEFESEVVAMGSLGEELRQDQRGRGTIYERRSLFFFFSFRS